MTKKTDDKAEKKLQELLAKAQTALEAAKTHAILHDLQFEFHGLRRGPEDKGTHGENGGGHWHELYEDLEENGSVVKLSKLDISEKWVGSGAWC